MFTFSGIHLSGPLDGGEFKYQISKYGPTFVKEDPPKSKDKKYNLALSVKSPLLTSIFNGISKLAHLSEQPQIVKDIWSMYEIK